MTIAFSRRKIMGAGVATTMLAGCGGAGCGKISPDPEADASWADIVNQARGQSVYWNAWAGDERTNAYIAWAAQQIEANYGVLLVHVN